MQPIRGIAYAVQDIYQLLSHLYTVAEAELFKHVNVTTPDMVGRNRMAAAIKVTASVF